MTHVGSALGEGHSRFAQFDDKDWSLCDAISFAVAEQRGAITFSFDHHFLQMPKLAVWGIKR